MKHVLFVILLLTSLCSWGQQYTGMSGLIHVPSAEMDSAGDVRIGAHFLNKHFTPGDIFSYEGEKYHTYSYYMSITPFKWIEIGYTCTLFKQDVAENYDGHGYEEKDRYLSLKISPLRERKYIPAIAVGCNDPSRITEDKNGKRRFFMNYYVVATKHVSVRDSELGFHLAYRYYKADYNKKWNGVVGGVTYRPSFYKPLRAIVEYTGNEVNVGADCLLWKHLLLQASLQDGKYFSGGVCFQMNLF